MFFKDGCWRFIKTQRSQTFKTSNFGQWRMPLKDRCWRFIKIYTSETPKTSKFAYKNQRGSPICKKEVCQVEAKDKDIDGMKGNNNDVVILSIAFTNLDRALKFAQAYASKENKIEALYNNGRSNGYIHMNVVLQRWKHKHALWKKKNICVFIWARGWSLQIQLSFIDIIRENNWSWVWSFGIRS